MIIAIAIIPVRLPLTAIEHARRHAALLGLPRAHCRNPTQPWQSLTRLVISTFKTRLTESAGVVRRGSSLVSGSSPAMMRRGSFSTADKVLPNPRGVVAGEDVAPTSSTQAMQGGIALTQLSKEAPFVESSMAAMDLTVESIEDLTNDKMK